jgi:hypothetical protein
LQFFLHEPPVLAELLQDVSETAGLVGSGQLDRSFLVACRAAAVPVVRDAREMPPDGGGAQNSTNIGFLIIAVEGSRQAFAASLVAGITHSA